MQLWNERLLMNSGPTPFNTVTYNYTGAVQTFVVPAGNKKIRVQVYGASGGNSGAGGAGFGGNGGYTACDLAVTPGEILYLYVGSGGGNGELGNYYQMRGGGSAGINAGGASGVLAVIVEITHYPTMLVVVEVLVVI